jgi:hypothetical protein
MGQAEVVGQQPVDAELLARAQTAADKGRAAYQEFWKLCTHMDRAMLSERSDHHDKLKERAAKADSARTVDSPAPAPAPAPAAAAPATDTQQAGGATGTEGGEFKPTYANLFDMMKKAAGEKNSVALDVAGDWIGDIQDAKQREELTAHFQAFQAEIAGGTQP